MKTKALIITAVVVATGLTAWNIHASYAHGPGGYGRGYSMMQEQGHWDDDHRGNRHRGHRYGMKQGMGPGMGKGYGSRDCGYGQNQTLDTPLTIEDVRAKLELRLKWRGNDRLKVGTVSETDDKTIVAEIVTIDDSLVYKVEIDKATGRQFPAK